MNNRGSNRKVLLKNTIMLYILTFSTYVLNFIVVPYETRVLHKEYFAVLTLATAIMVYFQLIMDFGFILSATEEVSIHREDRPYLSRIFTSVTINKLMLAAGSFIVLYFLCQWIPRWHEFQTFLYLFFFNTLVTSLMPDYLYRGMEKMSVITIRTVLIRVFFTLLIFLLLKKPEDYLLIPILYLIGNGVALFCVYVQLYYQEGIHFTRCSLRDAGSTLKKSLTFFFSRIATTVYSVANIIILDFLFAGSATAFYGTADKLVTTAKNGLSPISDSLYPYMTRNHDYKLVRKILAVIMPVIIAGCTVVFIWAKPLCIWFLGEEYAEAAPVLRAMLPVVVMILPSYICGFPMLSSMGLSKHANYSVVCGSAVHVLGLVILYFFGALDMVSLAAMVSFTESVVLLYRLIVIYRNRDRIIGGEKE